MGISFDVIKTAAKALQKADNIELYTGLIEIQQKIIDIQEENVQLREENKNLIEKLKVKGEVEFRENAYWLGEDGPYCPRCYNKEQDLIRLNCLGNGSRPKCPECDNAFEVTSKKGESPYRNQFRNRPANFR